MYLRPNGMLHLKFSLSGQILPAIFLIATGYLGCDRVLAVVMVTLAVGTSGLAMTGYGVNHLDVAPPFAGKVADNII